VDQDASKKISSFLVQWLLKRRFLKDFFHSTDVKMLYLTEPLVTPSGP
jgi:hypothetical protein